MKNILLKGLFVSVSVIFLTSSVSAMTCTNLTKTLSKGSENSEVLKLQQFLFDGGYLTAKPNGYFGNGTVMAVKKFQQANGLSQVGSVGPGTRGKIKDLSCREVKDAVIISKKNLSLPGIPLNSRTISSSPDVVMSLQDIKNISQKELERMGYVSPVSVVINDNPVVFDSTSTKLFGAKKEMVNDYSIKVYANKNSYYPKYLILETIENIPSDVIAASEKWGGQIGFGLMGFKCSRGLEVRSELGSNLCESKNIRNEGIRIYKNYSIGFGTQKLSVKGKGNFEAEFVVFYPSENGLVNYYILHKGITLALDDVR